MGCGLGGGAVALEPDIFFFVWWAEYELTAKRDAQRCLVCFQSRFPFAKRELQVVIVCVRIF